MISHSFESLTIEQITICILAKSVDCYFFIQSILDIP